MAALRSNALTAYHYFSFRDSQKQEVLNCLSSLVAQLVQKQDVPPEVGAIYRPDLKSIPQIPAGILRSESLICVVSNEEPYAVELLGAKVNKISSPNSLWGGDYRT